LTSVVSLADFRLTNHKMETVRHLAAPRSRQRNINARSRADTLDRHIKAEVFRTPAYAYTPLLDYCPEWFEGVGFDPSAGDGRMIAEIVQRGNVGPHYLNDLRGEDEALMRSNVQGAHVTIGDYLSKPTQPVVDFTITNPPFTLAVDFVKKARTHTTGPICILQSVAWQGTRKRSAWLKGAGLAYVLNLPRRPKWEVEIGKAPSNIWDFAWFVFLPEHHELPRMDWLL
jgi:hypothetical protein